MHLKHLSDSDLHSQVKTLVREERELLTRILWHLHEVDRRKLFSAMKYKSLFEYAVKELQYSEDQAYRRISAMRLLRELPELEERIDDGRLSLTTISKAQTFFRRLGKTTKKEKSDILERLQNKSTREIEVTLNAISPEAAKIPDQVRAVDQETVEIRFRAPRELEVKLEKLKGLLAHKYPHLSLAELVDKLADLGLEAWNPARVPSRVIRKRCVGGVNIVAQDRRDVWREAGNRCENCGSAYALEIDHRHPRALGGTSERANLRLLCRQCNQRQAVEKIGVGAMEWRADRTIPLMTDKPASTKIHYGNNPIQIGSNKNE